MGKINHQFLALKSIFMKHWQLTENQLLLRQIDKEPPIISPKRGKSLKGIYISLTLRIKSHKHVGGSRDVRLVNPL